LLRTDHGNAPEDEADRLAKEPSLPEVRVDGESPPEALQALRGNAAEELKVQGSGFRVQGSEARTLNPEP
jgi:hypothetical protein